MLQRHNHIRSFKGGQNRFSQPHISGSFAKPQYYRRSRFNGQNSRSLSSNPSLFIKKASTSETTEAEIIHQSFAEFNLVEAVKTNIKNHGYLIPTPIQDQAIEPILQDRDLIGLANTGTGKTAAFLIPVINKIYQNRDQGVLIIAPTRELAMQIYEEAQKFTANMKIYSAVVIGGANINKQIQVCKRSPHILIATPGRLRDLIQRKAIYLADYSTFILDEVDLMVDIGFINDVKYFVSLLPQSRQSLFFSATISPKIQEILQNFVSNAITVSVKQQDTVENIDQDVVMTSSPGKKIDTLHDLLIKDGFDKVLIFNRTKRGVEQLNKELISRGFKVGAIHGNKRQSQRQRILQSFKENQIQILLATDVASRGLDIDNVTHVINYDLPETYDDYIHRIGRTGRAGKAGKALTFI
ncbi:DEAD/DEAH box helicase [Patescibacteria group bacterium]|nr:DEAD/DEAH box helicase [Patescibacteria group bacterium]MCL5409546.1 DEAD/DEAH box helicase [Patescibacteria group bacterium]